MSPAVGLVRCDDYDVSRLHPAIERLIDLLGGIDRFASPGDRVLVKPNCIVARPPDQPAQTHPAVILAVCRRILDAGAKPFVGDSPSWGSLGACISKLGLTEPLQHLGVPIVEFKNPVKAPNPAGRVFKFLHVDRAALDADRIINLPKLKAHSQLGLTVAVKNMFGCVAGKRKAWWHCKVGSYQNYFAHMLLETFELLAPAVSIIDGIVAMQGDGPIRGEPRHMGVLLASQSGLALERVCCELVAYRHNKLRVLRAAKEAGLNPPSLDDIQILGDPLEPAKVNDFLHPRPTRIGFSLPRLVKSTLKQAWILHQERAGAA